jgi:hypothetical protein
VSSVLCICILTYTVPQHSVLYHLYPSQHRAFCTPYSIICIHPITVLFVLRTVPSVSTLTLCPMYSVLYLLYLPFHCAFCNPYSIICIHSCTVSSVLRNEPSCTVPSVLHTVPSVSTLTLCPLCSVLYHLNQLLHCALCTPYCTICIYPFTVPSVLLTVPSVSPLALCPLYSALMHLYNILSFTVPSVLILYVLIIIGKV